MRLFVAVPVPSVVREVVDEVVAPIRADDRLAWTRPNGWHVTLAFLGEVAAERAPEVGAAVRRVLAGASPGSGVTLTTGRARAMGRSVLALEVRDDPAGALARIGAAVQAACADADLPVTQRPVRGHLTLGRARRGRSIPEELVAAVHVTSVAWPLETVQVVRSVLGRGPATYEVVEEVPAEEG